LLVRRYHPEFDLREAALLMNVASPLLLDQGTFTAQADIDAHVAMMLELVDDPSRADLRLRLGVDDDVMDPMKRWAVVSRWLTELVYPSAFLDATDPAPSENAAAETAEPAMYASVATTLLSGTHVAVSYPERQRSGTGAQGERARAMSTQAAAAAPAATPLECTEVSSHLNALRSCPGTLRVPRVLDSTSGLTALCVLTD
jgi:hypothetical protein